MSGDGVIRMRVERILRGSIRKIYNFKSRIVVAIKLSIYSMIGAGCSEEKTGVLPAGLYNSVSFGLS